MSDFKRVAGNLQIVDGDLVLFTSEAEATQQRLDINLNLYQGEWWLDVTRGIPYLQEILSVKGSRGAAESLIKEAILSTNNILKITEFDTEFNYSTGRLSVSFQALTEDGDIVSVQNKEIT